MTDAVIRMPLEMAMRDAISRLQFHARAQSLLDDYRALEVENFALRSGTGHLGALIDELRAELEQAKKDAERYRWLTADHADAEMRDLAEDTGIRLRWIGKGAADAAIDAAIAKEAA